MKRSGSVALLVMGTAAFAASFAGGSAYLAWSKPGAAAAAAPQQPQSLASPQQNCTTRPDGTRVCQPQQRSAGYHFFWGNWGSSNQTEAKTQPQAKTKTAAFAPAQRSATPGVTTSDAARGGFGAVAHANMRASAGG